MTFSRSSLSSLHMPTSLHKNTHSEICLLKFHSLPVAIQFWHQFCLFRGYWIDDFHNAFCSERRMILKVVSFYPWTYSLGLSTTRPDKKCRWLVTKSQAKVSNKIKKTFFYARNITHLLPTPVLWYVSFRHLFAHDALCCHSSSFLERKSRPYPPVYLCLLVSKCSHQIYRTHEWCRR